MLFQNHLSSLECVCDSRLKAEVFFNLRRASHNLVGAFLKWPFQWVVSEKLKPLFKASDLNGARTCEIAESPLDKVLCSNHLNGLIRVILDNGPLPINAVVAGRVIVLEEIEVLSPRFAIFNLYDVVTEEVLRLHKVSMNLIINLDRNKSQV